MSSTPSDSELYATRAQLGALISSPSRPSGTLIPTPQTSAWSMWSSAS